MNAMLFAATMQVLGAAPVEPTCTLHGTLQVLSNGKAVTPENAEVYVSSGVSSKPQRAERKMAQRNRRFVPNVLVVEREDTVVFENQDDELHEIHCDKDANTFDSARNERPVTTRRQFLEEGVSRLGCHVHAKMSALILTVPNRFHVSVAANGAWTIAGVPNRELTLRFWDPRAKAEVRTVAACEQKSIDVTITVGNEREPALDLGPGYGFRPTD